MGEFLGINSINCIKILEKALKGAGLKIEEVEKNRKKIVVTISRQNEQTRKTHKPTSKRYNREN